MKNFCTSCGARLESCANFCGHCGTALATAAGWPAGNGFTLPIFPSQPFPALSNPLVYPYGTTRGNSIPGMSGAFTVGMHPIFQ